MAEVRYTVDDTDDLSAYVVEAIDEATAYDMDDEDCVLYDYLDIEALAAMLRHKRKDGTIKVEFTTENLTVLVYGNREMTVEVMPLDAPDPRTTTDGE